MAIQGDLSTIDLADLLQNLEQNQRTGLLSIEGEDGSVRMYVDGGKLTLLATDERPKLIDVLVASGAVAPAQIEEAKKRRRRKRKSLGEVLVAMGVIDQGALVELARDRLLGDVCETMASGTGAFTFDTGPVPRGVFDSEERRLELSLPIGPMLLEAARRSDHWRRIRQRVPSDVAHFQPAPRGKRPVELEQDAMTGALLELCDGTRSVAEVMSGFPHKRFEAYERLSQLVEARTVRATEADEMARIALGMIEQDLDRAWELVCRGRALHSQHADLLEAQVRLAAERGEPETAVEGLKVLAHQRWESGDVASARDALARARELDPEDPALWERTLEIALREGEIEEATDAGKHLAELYRAPGLYTKARDVVETLVEADPESWDLQREWGRSLADCGEVERAIHVLESFGKKRLSDEEWDAAREVFEEILGLDPARSNARDTLQRIETGAFERMIVRRKVLARRGSLVVAGLVVVVWLFFEGAARRAYVAAVREVTRTEMIEAGRYEDAAQHIEGVARRFPFTSTAIYDVSRHAAELRARAEAPGD